MGDFGDVRSAVHENNFKAINRALESLDCSKEEAKQALDYVLEIRGPGALLWNVQWVMHKDDHDVEHPIWLRKKHGRRRTAIYRIGQQRFTIAAARLDLVQMWLCERVLPFLYLWCQGAGQRKLIDLVIRSLNASHGQIVYMSDIGGKLYSHWRPCSLTPRLGSFKNGAFSNDPWQVLNAFEHELIPLEVAGMAMVGARSKEKQLRDYFELSYDEWAISRFMDVECK